MPTFDLKNATLKIKDGKTVPNELTVKIGEGNLTYSETQERIYEKDRGVLDSVRDGDDTPLEVRFDFRWEYIIAQAADTDPTVEEALKKIGKAAAWITTSSDACEPYCIDLEFENDASCTGQLREIFTFSEFRHEKLDHDAKNSTVSCTGKCNITTPTIVRET